MANSNANTPNWKMKRDVFMGKKLDLRDSSPGVASNDVDLQTEELERPFTDSKSKANPYLILKNIPNGMTVNTIKNVCQLFGNVKNCTEAPNCPYVFVNFANITDLEAVHRGLNKSDIGFEVSLGRTKKFTELEEHDVENDSNISNKVDHNTPRLQTIDALEKKLSLPNLITKQLKEKVTFHSVLEEGDGNNLERPETVVSSSLFKTGGTYQHKTEQAYKTSYEEEKNSKKSDDYSNDLFDKQNKLLPKIPKNGSLEVRTNKCVVCIVSQANLFCYRCGPEVGIFYCSRKCQIHDWDEHRIICGQHKYNPNALKPLKMRNYEFLPKLKTSPSRSRTLDKGFPIPSTPPPNSKVGLTWIQKSNLVFIRSKDLENEARFLEFINKIQSASKELSPLKVSPTCGKAVITKLRNKQFGRALVLSAADPDNIKVNFLDYGNIEVKKLSNLYEAPKELIDETRFAIPVKLKNVPNTNMTNRMQTYMNSYSEGVDLRVEYDLTKDLVPESYVYEVDLYDAETNEHLNNKLTELLKLETVQTTEEIIMIKDIPFADLPLGDDIILYVMDNSNLHVGCISCTTKDYALEIEKFSGDIQRYANSLKQQNYSPRPNELCIAKYSDDNLWYRGKCLERTGDDCPTRQFIIQYIDYGNTDVVSINDIRPYPSKFTWPLYTADCAIAGLPEDLDGSLVEKLQDLLVCGHRLKCDCVEKEEGNFYILTLKNVLNLVKMNN